MMEGEIELTVWHRHWWFWERPVTYRGVGGCWRDVSTGRLADPRTTSELNALVWQRAYDAEQTRQG